MGRGVWWDSRFEVRSWRFEVGGLRLDENEERTDRREIPAQADSFAGAKEKKKRRLTSVGMTGWKLEVG